MRRGALGLVLMTVIAVVAIGAQGALAGPVQSLTACLKVTPGEPLGTAVYSWWDDETRRLEITVAGDPLVVVSGDYCVFIDKVRLADVKLTVDETGAGALKLDTRWGNVIPEVFPGSTITLKSCTTEVVLCGMFK